MLGRANPAVGLLSIGEEPEKGNAVDEGGAPAAPGGRAQLHRQRRGTRPARRAPCDRGPIDVVVCDGFVGNVVLKFYEAIAPFIIGLLAKAGVDQKTMMGALKQLDYSEHGGAPLLGVNGVSIISHGKSSPRAIKNAIKVAVQAVDAQHGRAHRPATRPRRTERRREATDRVHRRHGARRPGEGHDEPRFRGARDRDDRRVDRRAHRHRAAPHRGDGDGDRPGRRRVARRRWSAPACTPGEIDVIVAQHGDAGPAAAVDGRRPSGRARRDARRRLRRRRRVLGIHLRHDRRRRHDRDRASPRPCSSSASRS